MVLVNIDHIPGRDFDVIGVVKGSTVRTKNFIRDFGAGLKNIVGGEVKSYTKLLNEARQIATKRMVEDATKLGADAVINVRYSTSAVMAGAAEMLVYGTAVKLH